jgi:DNA alkylation repair enzyme
MAEPLKKMYDGNFLERFGSLLQSAWPAFDAAEFAESVRGDDWERLELKERIRRITERLGAGLPSDYEDALDVLYRIDERCTGFPYLFFPDFVELYGMAEMEKRWDRSMEALARFTSRSSSEFAVRPFILADPERMAAQMLEWADHPDEHVRRLASEGARPRLPWAQALPMFKRDPSPMLPVLEKLKADSSLYVRKSVANHWNDISKDHPELVMDMAERWLGRHPHTDWIVRHACRTLIKRSEPKMMRLFGYAAGGDRSASEALIEDASIALSREELAIGEETVLRCRLLLAEGEAGAEERVKLRIEYGIDFVKSGGRTSLKRFLLSDREYRRGDTIEATRRHSFADLTTRKHYAGKHVVSLWVNGVKAAETELLVRPAAMQ